MAVLKIELTPQPAVARARSGALQPLRRAQQAAVWFEGAFVREGSALGRQLANILVALLTPAVSGRVGHGTVARMRGPRMGRRIPHRRRILLALAGVDCLVDRAEDAFVFPVAWDSRTAKISEEN